MLNTHHTTGMFDYIAGTAKKENIYKFKGLISSGKCIPHVTKQHRALQPRMQQPLMQQSLIQQPLCNNLSCTTSPQGNTPDGEHFPWFSMSL